MDSTAYQLFKGALVSGRRPRPGTLPPAILPFDPLGTSAERLAALAAAPPGRSPVPRSGGTDASAAAGHDGDGPGSDMEAAVDALAAEGRRWGRAVHNVWLPPLPAAIAIDEVLAWPSNGRDGNGPAMPGGAGPVAPGEAGWLRVPVGVVDRPRAQAQEPLLLDFSGGAGHLAVVGAPRSGKSTLLCSLVAGFALTHRSEDVQLYAIDLGGGLLHQLGRLPHVGAVCGKGEAGHATPGIYGHAGSASCSATPWPSTCASSTAWPPLRFADLLTT